MSKFIEVEGNTIAEAIQRGLSELDLTLEEVDYEVITRPKSGFFGFGASKAKVKITVKEQTPPQVVEKISEKPAKPKFDKPKVEKQTEKPVKKPVEKAPRAEKTEKSEEVVFSIEYKENILKEEQKVCEFIDGLLEKMGINGKAKVLVGQENEILVNIEGEGMGSVIGRRGDTLDAIQYISNLVLKSSEEASKKVRVDCENYRQKRALTLEKLALKMGHKVIKYKKNMTLEPMNPFERRVIHEVLQNFRGVSTYSTGKEPNRRVVIAYGEKKDK